MSETNCQLYLDYYILCTQLVTVHARNKKMIWSISLCSPTWMGLHHNVYTSM